MLSRDQVHLKRIFGTKTALPERLPKNRKRDEAGTGGSAMMKQEDLLQAAAVAAVAGDMFVPGVSGDDRLRSFLFALPHPCFDVSGGKSIKPPSRARGIQILSPTDVSSLEAAAIR